MGTKRTRYTANLLLLLYVGYFTCVSLFVHTHIYNGVTYVHSHPYKTADKGVPQEHHHTSGALFALNQMSSLMSNQAGEVISLEIARTPQIVLLDETQKISVDTSTHIYYSLRAPPYKNI